jgi:hypothetical protein
MKKIFTLSLLTILGAMQLCSAQPGVTNLVMMRSYLYVLGSGGDSTMLDGDLTQYDPSFSNALDGLDARKMDNFSENIGMIRGTTVLVIERRHTIQLTDTIFYKIWNLSASRNYQLQFAATNLSQPGLTAYLEDAYLATKTPVDLEGTTYANFKINADKASTDPFRFRIIFSTPASGAFPITFTGIKAYRQENDIKVDWATATENNLKDYTVEKSADGANFTGFGQVTPNHLPTDNYSFTDVHPAPGYNYYRILSTGVDGNLKYSAVTKVWLDEAFSLIRVFPNPVAGNTINLQLSNQPAGAYNIKLLSTFGQAVLSKQIQHPGGSSTEAISLPASLPHGMYILEITGDGIPKTSITIDN